MSPYSCYDMAGNVWEWCSSWYAQKAGQRVIRGGSWDSGPGTLRVSIRGRDATDDRFANLGFRLVQDIP